MFLVIITGYRLSNHRRLGLGHFLLFSKNVGLSFSFNKPNEINFPRSFSYFPHTCQRLNLSLLLKNQCLARTKHDKIVKSDTHTGHNIETYAAENAIQKISALLFWWRTHQLATAEICIFTMKRILNSKIFNFKKKLFRLFDNVIMLNLFFCKNPSFV